MTGAAGADRLLPQSGGFEGVLALRKRLAPDDLAIAHGPEVSNPVLDGCSGAQRTSTEAHHHDDPIAGIDELLRLKDDLLERRGQIHEEPSDFIVTLVCPSPDRLPHDAFVHPVEGAIPISPAGRVVATTKRLDISLRHCLPPLPCCFECLL